MSPGEHGPRTAAPRSAWLVLLVLCALAPPFVLRAFGTSVGSFSMFTQPIRYRLRVLAHGPRGEVTPVRLGELTPHLGRDARRILVPAESGFVGETHVELVAGGLGDLAVLTCAVRHARSVDVVLDRSSVTREPLPGAIARVMCDEAGD